MKRIVVFFWVSTWLFSESTDVETHVLGSIERILEQEGRVRFSDLYNSDRFTPQGKAYLGRLYEAFFQIPGFLNREHRSTGRVPTIREIAAKVGINMEAVNLLLTVMASDPRIPPLFTRNPHSQKIESLNLENISAFLAAYGNQVQVTQWAGKPLPSFQLVRFNGQTISSRDLTGKNALIYFWFTGCPPCVRIAPILADLNRKYGSSNFRVIGFNADQVLGLTTSDEERKNHLEKLGGGFANAHLDRATRRAFGNVNVFPTLFLVKKDGIIFRHMINYQNREILEEVINNLIPGPEE